MANLQVKNISDALHDRLRSYARESNSTISATVLAAVERELARWEWRKHLAQRPETDLGIEAAALLWEERSLPRPGDGVTRFVIDASVAVEYLLRTPLGSYGGQHHR